MTISGSLGGASGASSKVSMMNFSGFAVTDYKVRCVTLSSDPQAGEGDVSSDGSFSLDISVSDDESVPIGCFIVLASDSSVAATFSFDSGESGIGSGSGNAQSGSVNGGRGETIDFGSINFDADKGTAVVDNDNISRGGNTSDTNSGDWADPTGDWTMTCILSDSTYTCPEEANSSNQFPIYLNQVEALDGASETHRGLAIWRDQSTFSSCGSTENLDDVLPAGWTAVDSNMNNDFSFSGSLPAASSLDAPAWDGSKGHCGTTISEGTTKCSDITNVDSWDFGGGTLTDADCQALCQADMVREANDSCMARYTQNHSVVSGASPGDIATEVASFDGTKTASDFLVRDTDKPDGRHVLGELQIEGDTGTVMDTNTFTEHFCQDNGDGSGCTDRTCYVTENVRVTMKQESATSAIIEVVITSAMDSTNSDAQCFQSVSGNHLEEWVGNTQKFLLSASKN